MNTLQINNYTFKFDTNFAGLHHRININDGMDVIVNDDDILKLVKFLLDNTPRVQSIVKEMTQ